MLHLIFGTRVAKHIFCVHCGENELTKRSLLELNRKHKSTWDDLRAWLSLNCYREQRLLSFILIRALCIMWIARSFCSTIYCKWWCASPLFYWWHICSPERKNKRLCLKVNYGCIFAVFNRTNLILTYKKEWGQHEFMKCFIIVRYSTLYWRN